MTIWSGLNTTAGVDEYEANPTQEALDEGRAKERRTNILIGVTAGLAVTTVVLALLTDFGSASDDAGPPTTLALTPLPNGAAAVLSGSF